MSRFTSEAKAIVKKKKKTFGKTAEKIAEKEFISEKPYF